VIVYLYVGALVRRYVAERDSNEVAEVLASATAVGTSIISRTETNVALAKAVRMGC